MKITDKVFDLIYLIVSLFYPNKCPGCGVINTENDGYLCDFCDKHIERIDQGKRCVYCGLEKPNCDCNKFIYYFDSCVSAFKNNGIAQQAFYSFKFSRKICYAPFFAGEMATAVEKAYKNIKFDMIVPVPTSIKSVSKYGFSPVKELSFELSDILDVPVNLKVLKCKQSKKPQHSGTLLQRVENVRGEFYSDCHLNGKKILLVDDIKTTGSTLSECARVIKFAGADCVCCVTALATQHSVKDKKDLLKKT